MAPHDDNPSPPPSDLIDTEPGRPALLRSPEIEPAGNTEPGLPSALFDDLLLAAKGTPAMPERADSSGAKNARFSGDGGRPQKARQETKPTGEVLVEPTATAIREAPKAGDIDLEALAGPRTEESANLLRGALRSAMTEPSARALVLSEDAGDARETRRRAVVAVVIGMVLASVVLGIAAFFFRDRAPVPEAPRASPPAQWSAASLASALPLGAAPTQSGAHAPAPSVAHPAPTPPASSPSQAVAKATIGVPAAPPSPAALTSAAPVGTGSRPALPVPSDITHNIN